MSTCSTVIKADDSYDYEAVVYCKRLKVFWIMFNDDQLCNKGEMSQSSLHSNDAEYVRN